MLSVNIKKRLGHFYLHAALEAAEGITGVLGASGCGKSMTLRCIAGIEKPDEGRIVLNGETLFDSEKGINLPPQKRRVGYLFQNYALFPNMTVEKNILCGLHSEKDKEKRKKALWDVMELMQLKGLEHHRPHQLSGGQAQRAALARILVNKPHILMLDEPFAALDSHLRDQLQIQVKQLLQGFDGPVLMVTHSRDEAYRLCGHIALMEQGAMLPVKPTKQLFADPGTVAAAQITGCKNIASAVKTGEHEVEVPEWGLRLAVAKPVGDALCAVGIRAHYFGSRVEQNSFAVQWTDEMEEPFEWILRFRYAGQKADTPDVWWRIPKDKKPQNLPPALGIAPANVLLLYPPASAQRGQARVPE